MYNDLLQYGVSILGGRQPADYGFHSSQNPYKNAAAPAQNPPQTQPAPPNEEQPTEESIWALLGAQGDLGGGGRGSGIGNHALSQYKDMSEYASVPAVLSSLNGIRGRTGQPQYQDMYDGFRNPYIQQLIRGY